MKYHPALVFMLGATALSSAAVPPATAHAAVQPTGANSILPTITISGDGITPLTLKTSELSLLPQQTTTVGVNGVPTTESGPYVSALLAYAGVTYISACKNDELRYWVEATSSNGSAAEVSAGEMDPGFGNKPAILSIDEGGKFLTTSGPKLIVPGDATAARDIPHVTKLTIGRAPTELAEVNPACNPPSFAPPVAAPPPGSVVINGHEDIGAAANQSTTLGSLQLLQHDESAAAPRAPGFRTVKRGTGAARRVLAEAQPITDRSASAATPDICHRTSRIAFSTVAACVFARRGFRDRLISTALRLCRRSGFLTSGGRWCAGVSGSHPAYEAA